VRHFNPVYVADGVRLRHSAMSAQCPHCPKADVDPRIVMSQSANSRRGQMQ
jgi:hypothetical protein